jgi:hypothetical protein
MRSHRLVLVLALFAAVAVLPGQTSAADAPPPELQLIPPDAVFMVHINVSGLMSREPAKQLLDLLPRERGVKPEDVGLRELGVRLSDVESLAILADRPGGADLTVVRTRKPYDRDRVLGIVAPRAVAEVHMGKTAYIGIDRGQLERGGAVAPDPRRVRLPSPAVSFLDDRTYVTGNAFEVFNRFLVAAVKADDKHPLYPVLLGAGRHHLTVGVALTDRGRQDLRWDMRQSDENLSSLLSLAGLHPLLAAERALLTVDVGDESRLDAGLTFASPRAADKGRDAGRFALSLLKGGLNPVEDDLLTPDGKGTKAGAEKGLALLDALRKSLDDAQGKVEGSTVKLGMRLKTEGGLVKAAVVEILFRAHQVRDRQIARGRLKQLVLGLHNYAEQQNRLPSAVVSRDGKPLFSWRVELLPFVELAHVYQALRRDEPWDSAHNKPLLAKVPDVFKLPGVEAPEGHTFFQLFTGRETLFDPQPRFAIGSIPDGLSNTILVAESAESVHWAAPGDIPYSGKVSPVKQVGNHYGTGTLVVFADGDVRTIPATVTERDLRAAITPSGGEALGASLFDEEEAAFRRRLRDQKGNRD